MATRASSGGSGRKKPAARKPAPKKRMPDGPIAYVVTLFGQFLLVLWKLIAHTVGGAARAVGMAMSRNPFAPIVPCHRVLRSDGSLGGYRWGLDRKAELLRREKTRA